MPSFRNEVKNPIRYNDRCFNSERKRTRYSKRKLPQHALPINKRRHTVFSYGNSEKRQLFWDENGDVELEELERSPTPQIRDEDSERASSERDNMEDPDYLAFLEILMANSDFYSNLGKLDQPVSGKNSDKIVSSVFKSSDNEVMDPHYRMFLENARKDGHSYVIEMKKNDGNMFSVKYEEKKKQTTEDLHKKNNTSSNGTGKRANTIHRAKPKPKPKPLDKDYVKENGCPTQKQKQKPPLDKDYGRENGFASQKQKSKPLDKENGCASQKLKPKPLHKDSGKENGRANENLGHSPPHWFLSDCKPGTISSADESYLKFLDHIWVKGNMLTYQFEDVIVRYEDDGVVINSEEERPRPRQILSDYDEYEEKYTPPTNLKSGVMDMNEDDDDPDAVQIIDDGSVKVNYEEKLKNKLREVLLKPYDWKELAEKLKDAKLRKPMEKTRIMRGRNISYPTNRDGLSYLDHHPDLKDMLRAASKGNLPQKALSLLRCLFFYYENLSHQGSFIPWKNPPSWLHTIICDCSDTLKCPCESHGETATLN